MNNMNHKQRRPIEKMRNDIVKIISESKPIFFVSKDFDGHIPNNEIIYETRAEICNQVEMYFSKLLESNLIPHE